MLPSKTLNLTKHGVTLDITVRAASVRDEIYKSVAALRLDESVGEDSSDAVTRFSYVNCLGCSVGTVTFTNPPVDAPDDSPSPYSISVRDLTFHQFAEEIPGSVFRDWTRAVYEMNPEWRAGARAPAESLGNQEGDDD